MIAIRNSEEPPIAPPIIADVFFFPGCAGELPPLGFGSAVLVANPPEERLGTCVEVVVNLKLSVDTRGNLRAKMSDSSESAQPRRGDFIVLLPDALQIRSISG